MYLGNIIVSVGKQEHDITRFARTDYEKAININGHGKRLSFSDSLVLVFKSPLSRVWQAHMPWIHTSQWPEACS